MDAETEDIHQVILNELGQGHTQDQVIYQICENYNLDWSEAERMVRELAHTKAHIVTLKQTPWLILLALSTFSGGAGLSVYSVYAIVTAATLYRNANLLDQARLLPGLPHLFDSVWAYLFLGLAMMVGSVTGMKVVWLAIFDWFERTFLS